MGRPHLLKLDGRVYKCRFCNSHLTSNQELISKNFHGRSGKAYLFNIVVNVVAGAKEDRMMTSGLHTVSDIFCLCCNQIVGWRYDRAYDMKQKYKEGKFILEMARTVGGELRDFHLESFPSTSRIGSALAYV